MGNPWMDHVKTVSKANKGKGLKEILKMAKKTYKRSPGVHKKVHKKKHRKTHKKTHKKRRKSRHKKRRKTRRKSRKKRRGRKKRGGGDNWHEKGSGWQTGQNPNEGNQGSGGGTYGGNTAITASIQKALPKSQSGYSSSW